MYGYQSDPRYLAIYYGLSQLTDMQLRRLMDYPKCRLILDELNYSQETMSYCPLAVALGIPFLEVPAMTNEVCVELMRLIGGPHFLFNQLKNIKGEFFRGHRLEDFLLVFNDVLRDRKITNYIPVYM
jgi:hypothetical protein